MKLKNLLLSSVTLLSVAPITSISTFAETTTQVSSSQKESSSVEKERDVAVSDYIKAVMQYNKEYKDATPEDQSKLKDSVKKALESYKIKEGAVQEYLKSSKSTATERYVSIKYVDENGKVLKTTETKFSAVNTGGVDHLKSIDYNDYKLDNYKLVDNAIGLDVVGLSSNAPISNLNVLFLVTKMDNTTSSSDTTTPKASDTQTSTDRTNLRDDELKVKLVLKDRNSNEVLQERENVLVMKDNLDAAAITLDGKVYTGYELSSDMSTLTLKYVSGVWAYYYIDDKGNSIPKELIKNNMNPIVVSEKKDNDTNENGLRFAIEGYTFKELKDDVLMKRTNFVYTKNSDTTASSSTSDSSSAASYSADSSVDTTSSTQTSTSESLATSSEVAAKQAKNLPKTGEKNAAVGLFVGAVVAALGLGLLVLNKQYKDKKFMKRFGLNKDDIK